MNTHIVLFIILETGNIYSDECLDVTIYMQIKVLGNTQTQIDTPIFTL